MTNRWSTLSITSMLAIAFSSPALPQSQSLEGLWRSQYETVYRLISRDREIIGVFEKPNAAQANAGIKPGDLAFKGDFITNVLTGTYFQRAPLEVQDICPEFKIIDSAIQWE